MFKISVFNNETSSSEEYIIQSLNDTDCNFEKLFAEVLGTIMATEIEYAKQGKSVNVKNMRSLYLEAINQLLRYYGFTLVKPKPLMLIYSGNNPYKQFEDDAGIREVLKKKLTYKETDVLLREYVKYL